MAALQNDLSAPTPLPPLSPPKVISGVTMALPTPPRALFFDVFGTCVDWRTTVTQALDAAAHAALNSATASLASRIRLRASDMTPAHWGIFAQEWRDGYKAFTRKLAADPSLPWKSIDEHHLESLKELLAKWELKGLWTDEEVRALSLIWHRLDPWADSASGIALLNQLFWTATLSNGNISLLSDLKTHGKMNFTHILSAELFGSYKPSPKVYLGAVEKLGLQPKDCAMVAAHLNDLRAAKDLGVQAIYVERPGEEEWSTDEVQKASDEGWVDLWVSQGVGSRGFVTVAEKLGIEVPTGTPKRLSSSA
ncbi:haloacid dehalogenase [Lentithecium fluviatile CBS 122367]|uniref:Haloacid dehalogenase n=1 Tax=Lentithecium fluviatile CBS 122367 TaxID=1168545 RepID=A0A6G1JC53_9PLEO|nr:haloacid dehalogenase [Lentithecium fluviatile CBS 122367]